MKASSTVLVAHESASVRAWVAAALRGLGQVTELDAGEAAQELALMGKASLVIISSTLADKTGTQVLAAVRASGGMVPFVIVTESSEAHVLAFVSEASGTRVERRVLGRHALRSLALRLLAQSARYAL